MIKIHNLGFPRIGAQRELKFALERYWRGEDSLEALEHTARSLRQRHGRFVLLRVAEHRERRGGLRRLAPAAERRTAGRGRQADRQVDHRLFHIRPGQGYHGLACGDGLPGFGLPCTVS